MKINLAVTKRSRAEEALCTFVGLIRSRKLLSSDEHEFLPNEFGAIHILRFLMDDIARVAAFFAESESMVGGGYIGSAVGYFRRKSGLFTRTELREVSKDLLCEVCRSGSLLHLDPFGSTYPWTEPYLKEGPLREELRSIAKQEGARVRLVKKTRHFGTYALIVRIRSERGNRSLDIPFRKVGKWYFPSAGQWNVR
ncbi:MAG: hypothetical protein HGA38_04855 [Candidatus Moranbacteria bacterium]|nr:hypothetical protein [Candidatus Moranbacteria bacterium]